MDTSLYDIRCKFVDLMNNDELTDEQIQQLGMELAEELRNKSSNIIAYIIDSESLLERIKGEEKRLADMRKMGEARLEKFKGYVKDNMETLELQKIQTELGTLSIAKNPISVEIVEEDKLPAEFKQEVVTIKVDKKAIAQHFKDTGEVPDGCIIHTDNTSLRIK